MSSSFSRRRPRRINWKRPVTTRTSDISWVDDIVDALSDVTSERTAHSLLNLFLDAPDKPPRLGYEKSTFGRLFGPQFLEHLREAKLGLSKGESVWLHDVNHDNVARPYSGRMSIEKFGEVTLLNRADVKGMVDAVRRRIHLQNPCRDSLGVLTLRASTEQKPVVRDFIRKHLDGDAAIGIRETTAGAYILEFHLPCPVWLRGKKARKDPRQTSDGTPLRDSLNLSFLSATKALKPPLTETDFLYESQTSFCLIGWDIKGWTAFSAVDCYFEDDTDADNPFMLAHYNAADDDDDEFSRDFDPIAIGELPVDVKLVKDPREYFLWVATIRVKRVQEEWSNVVCKLRELTKEYLSDPHIPLKRKNTNLGTAKGDSANLEYSEAWFKQTSILLTELVTKLCTLVSCLKRFLEAGRNEFNIQENKDISRKVQKFLWEISDSIEEMENVVEGLNHLQATVKDFKAQLGMHIAVDEGRAIRLQYINVTILQVFSPLALAGTIIQAGIFVFNVYVSYIALTVVLGVLTLNLERAIEWYDSKFGSIDKLVEPPKRDEVDTEHISGATQTGFSIPFFPNFIRRRLQKKPAEDTV